MGNSGENIDITGWKIVMIVLALVVTVGLFAKVHSIAYDTQVWNVAKATEIGYVYDLLPTLEGDAKVTINLERDKTFTLSIEKDKLTIKDNVNQYTYDLSQDVKNSYQKRDPKSLTITKKGSEISLR